MAGPEREDPGGGSAVITEKAKPKLKRPPMYRVVLLNDDYTPMEFVVWVLQAIFYKAPPEATRLMLDVHNHGKGVCGVFTYDVARTKAETVMKLAQQNDHPLQAVLEGCGSEDDESC